MTELAYDIARGASFKFNTFFEGSVVRCAISTLISKSRPLFVSVYVCMATHIARVWINWVRSPILLVVS